MIYIFFATCSVIYIFGRANACGMELTGVASERMLTIVDMIRKLLRQPYGLLLSDLQVSSSRCDRQIPQTKKPILSRDLVPSDRVTCTIGFGLNFLYKVEILDMIRAYDKLCKQCNHTSNIQVLYNCRCTPIFTN